MPRTETVLSIFLAAPGDVSEECERLYRIVNDLNSSMARRTGVRLELMRWNRDTSPTIANSPQDGINSQIPEYDVLIGILWHTIGTPTENHASGTVEEFELAKARHAKEPGSVEIMFYFKTSSPRSLKDLDADQLRGVLDFKSRIGDEGVLYAEFQSIDEFASKVQMDLSKYLLDRRMPDSEIRALEASGFRRIAIVDGNGEQNEPMEIYDTVEDDSEDEGFIELQERYLQELEKINSVVESMAKVINIIGDSATSQSERINSLLENVDINKLSSKEKLDIMRKAKISANQFARGLDEFSVKMKPNIPLFRSHLNGLTTSVADLAPYAIEFGTDESDLVDNLNEFLNSLDSMVESIDGFIKSMRGIPKMTTTFGRSRRDAERILRELVDIGNDAKSILHRAISLLKSGNKPRQDDT